LKKEDFLRQTKYEKRTRYRDRAKGQFQFFMDANVHNVKRLLTIHSLPLFQGAKRAHGGAVGFRHFLISQVMMLFLSLFCDNPNLVDCRHSYVFFYCYLLSFLH